MISIRSRRESDNLKLIEIWHRSVCATHDFLKIEDREKLRPLILKTYLPALDVWIAENEFQEPLGFLGISQNKIEMLFVDAKCLGQGIGKELLDFLKNSHNELLLDVNEQNLKALSFYEKYGFKRTGRSSLDSQGNPYPLLHMKWVKS